MEQWEAMNFALDRIFGAMDAAPRSKPVQPRFSDLPEQQQRAEIAAYWARETYQQGMAGEAINEHASHAAIREAFRLGDTAELGRLVDRAIREYVGPLAEDER